MPNIMDALRARGVGVGSPLEGDAGPGDLREGKTAMNADGPFTGAVPVRAGGNVIPGPNDIVKLDGIYDIPITVKGVAGLAAGNIKKSAVVGGVTGTFDNGAQPGDTAIMDLPSVVSTSSSSPVIRKEIILSAGGTYRINFTISTSINGVPSNGRIYRNGVAVGMLRQNSTTTNTTFTEDIGGWLRGDLLQLYLWSQDGVAGAYCYGFALYWLPPSASLS